MYGSVPVSMPVHVANAGVPYPVVGTSYAHNSQHLPAHAPYKPTVPSPLSREEEREYHTYPRDHQDPRYYEERSPLSIGCCSTCAVRQCRPSRRFSLLRPSARAKFLLGTLSERERQSECVRVRRPRTKVLIPAKSCSFSSAFRVLRYLCLTSFLPFRTLEAFLKEPESSPMSPLFRRQFFSVRNRE